MDKLKEYPPSLCRAMALSVVDAFTDSPLYSTNPCEDDDHDAWVSYQDMFTSFDVYSNSEQNSMQADYNPAASKAS